MTPEQRELKPCPFCGGAARIESNRDWHRLYADHDEDCALYDANDLLMFPAQPGYLKEIADLWNRRAQVEALTAPQGWKLVPVEPTPEMNSAPNMIIQAYGALLIYQYMLQAAPTIPAIPGTKEGA